MTIANVTLTNTFDEWRTRTNQLISLYSETNELASASFNATNSSVSTAANIAANILTTDATYIAIITETVQNVVPEVISSNTIILSGIYDNANVITNNYVNSLNVTASFDQSNVALNTSVLAFNTANSLGLALNTANGNIVVAHNQANTATTIGSSAFGQANLAFVQANTATTIGSAAFGQANLAYNQANSALPNTSGVSFAGNLSFPSGNVGVGRTSSDYRLDVNGTINASNVLVNGEPLTASGGGANLVSDSVDTVRYVTFANNTSGVFSQANVSTSLTFNPSTGTLSATIFNSTSDLNKKYDVETIENSLNIVERLRGVGFRWKDNDKKSYGLIAQEVEEIIPELVETDHLGNKTLNYDAVIGFLVESVKELKKKLKE
jgi:hypothetical protein